MFQTVSTSVANMVPVELTKDVRITGKTAVRIKVTGYSVNVGDSPENCVWAVEACYHGGNMSQMPDLRELTLTIDKGDKVWVRGGSPTTVVAVFHTA